MYNIRRHNRIQLRTMHIVLLYIVHILYVHDYYIIKCTNILLCILLSHSNNIIMYNIIKNKNYSCIYYIIIIYIEL